MNTDKYLPIGTVVLLRNAKKRIMITGFAIRGKESSDKLYDYSGCLYPEGVISSNKNLLFDHNQIEKIYHFGYISEEEKEFKRKFNKLMDKHKDEILSRLNEIANKNNEQ